MGVNVMQQNYMLMQGNNVIAISANKLSAGVYTVKFTDEDGFTSTSLLVVE
jgi:hypothetical protein